MSSTFTQTAPFQWSGEASTNQGLVRRLLAALGTWHARRKAFAELSSLDDRILRDIGLDRSEILSVLSDRTGERRIGCANRSGVTNA